MRRGLRIACLIAGAAILFHSPVRAATITFSSSSALINPGDEFAVDIRVDGLEDDIFGFLLNITYDTSVLSLVPDTSSEGKFLITEGDFLTRAGQSNVPNVTDFNSDPLSQFPGILITNYIVSGTEIATGSGLLATLRFSASAAGNGNLALPYSEFTTSDFEIVDPPLQAQGSVVVSAPTPVPEPSTLALLGIGLAAMARKRLRRRSETSA